MLGLNTNLVIAVFLRLSEYGYLIAIIATLLETILGFGLIFPGSTIVLILGAVAGHGYLDISQLLLYSIFAAIIGDNINYLLGRRYGTKLLNSWFLNERHIKAATHFIKIKGSKSIFFSRLIPGLKEVTPFIAGSSKVEVFKFFFWNFLGSIAWGVEWAVGGYLLGQSLNLFGVWATRSEYLVIILILLAITYYLIEWLFVNKGQQFFSIIKSIVSSLAHALATNPDIKGFLKKHNKFALFLKNRLTNLTFYGLPFTIFSIIFLYILWLYIELINYSFFSDPIIILDENIANLLHAFRVDSFVNFFLWITLLAKTEIIIVFSVITVVLIWIMKRTTFIIPFIVTILGSAATMSLSKIIFERDRPQDAVYFEPTFSFPSGHSTMAIALYGFIAYMCIRLSLKWKRKVNIFFISFGIILAIGLSRLYLGVHFLTDVWGGYLIGALWLILGISISERILFKNSSHLTLVKTTSVVSKSLICLGIIFYIIYSFNYHPVLNYIRESEENFKVYNLKALSLPDNMKYTESIFGHKQEPISFIISANSDESLVNIFVESGWYLADPLNLITIKKMGASLVYNIPYREAPITPSFWNTEVNTFGFEKPTDSDNVKERHHARFWRTNYVTESGQYIYVGTASFDSGIKWGVTHKITPDIDTEREFLYNDLLRLGAFHSQEKNQFVNPMLGQNFAKDQFFTDGEVYLITLDE